MSREILAQRLARVRSAMEDAGCDYYVVPSADPHQSEYLPACWQRRAAISGFTGSAGTAVVGREQAWLWTDSRYWLQAARELDGGAWELMRQGASGVPEFGEWLRTTVAFGQAVGVDPTTISIEQDTAWQKALQRSGAKLLPIDSNLVDAAWDERPTRPAAAAFALDLRFTGEASASKIERVRAAMATEGCAAHVVSALDAVAWLFNIRGQDVDFNPVVVAFALIESERLRLFVDPGKIAAEALPAGVEREPYDALTPALRGLAAAGGRVWIDPSTASAAIQRALQGAVLHSAPSPITLMKAKKNPTEVAGARAAHVRDGVALARFFTWLEAEAPGGKVTEISAAAKLEQFRALGEHYRGASFDTISAMGDHGAIVHYSPGNEGHRVVDASSLFLLDSGGQYLDGTTDVTRTIMLGPPTAEQCDRFTRVLRGHIALALATFPERTGGRQLDVLARLPLWSAGLNYGHGTGHGVGAYLCVHEGPQRIATVGSDIPLEPGMIISNEPGYYEAGKWGIRTESLVVVEPRPGLAPDGQTFFGFETITLCPIDRGLTDREALLPTEREWLDAYHRDVREKLSPHLDGRERAWLERATAPL